RALNGGTLNIESWSRYNEHARAVITDIGIDIDRFLSSNERNRTLYRSLGLTGQATFFDKETWGADALVMRDGGGAYSPDQVARMPLSPEARKDLLRLYGKHHPD